MVLREYLNSLTRTAQVDFANRAGTTIGYLRKALSAGQSIGAEICVRIERESSGFVTRQDLRDDWQAIWPELEAQDPRLTLHELRSLRADRTSSRG